MSELSLLDLFRLDATGQLLALNGGLVALEHAPTAAEQLEACMRAAHSFKGAARIAGINAGVAVAHAIEDCFVAAQRGEVVLRQEHFDVLLRGVDLLDRIANTREAELGAWEAGQRDEVDEFLSDLTAALHSAQPSAATTIEALCTPVERADESDERSLNVSAHTLNRLLALAGESVVESRRLRPFTDSLLKLKRMHQSAERAFCDLQDAVRDEPLNSRAHAALVAAQQKLLAMRTMVGDRLTDLEEVDQHSTRLAQQLYDEALACRMRPFSDGVRGFPRMVRDLSRELGKNARLQIAGEDTQIDRDILAQLEAPLGHLLRNAIDHGIESPQERRAAGKTDAATILLEARHSGGMLQILVTDDGRGIDVNRLRKSVVERNFVSAEVAGTLSDAELLEFLFLPGFSMKSSVTEISGRGVGLDVVLNTIKRVRGSHHVSTEAGSGTRFQLRLPLSLSIVRALLVEIGGEPYAFPAAGIVRTLAIPRNDVETIEGRQLFTYDGQSVGLISAAEILQSADLSAASKELAVVLAGEGRHVFGLVVDRFLGERELVVQPLDARLGKIKDISAGALMEDGSPVLIVDIEEAIASAEKLIATRRLASVHHQQSQTKKRKRVLVVDDSLTVRELERKILDGAGYDVHVAVDGMDAWNAVRAGGFDLIVSDVDMPRMDGIELVALIRKDPNLGSLPVMIVSYKDRDEDRRRGLEAGADYYLTKSSFHDDTLLQAVIDLIGEAAP